MPTPPAIGAAPFRALIQRHVPDLAVERMALLPHYGWGGDSDAWLVNNTLIFRFPRRPGVAGQLAVESRLLPELAPTLPLAIPRFAYVAHDETTGLPLFVGYPAIPGEPLTPALLAELAPDAVAKEVLGATLGAFLGALHTFPADRARALGLEETREPEFTREFFDRVRELVYPRLTPAYRRWTDHLFSDYLANPRLWEFAPVLVHADLSSDHILYDRAAGRLGGIIDFGDTGISDPVSDFVGLVDYGPAFLHAALAAHTPPLDHFASARLAFYRRRVAFYALVWGAERDDPQALAEGMDALRAAVAAAS